MLNYQQLYNQLDISWYTKFYGEEPNDTFIIYIGLGNGSGNYGLSFEAEDDKKEIFAIMGSWITDQAGMITYPETPYLPIMIHEFSHSFVNHLNAMYKEDLRENGEKIFNRLSTEMKKQAYGNQQTMLNEALVRASVVKYMKDHNFSITAIDSEIEMQQNRGFLWIKELVEELDKYDSLRDQYPTLKSYMPQIIEAYNQYANLVNQYTDKPN